MNTLQAVSDSELLESTLAGSQNAFRSIVMRYQNHVFSVLQHYLRDKELSEDFTQDVFVRFYTTARDGKYNHRGKLKPYLLQIARNLAMDHFRKTAKMPTVTDIAGKEIFQFVNISEPNALDRLEKMERHEILRNAIRKLSPLQQEIITLRYFGKLSFQEISELTNINKNTCLGTASRAIKELRTYFLPKAKRYDRNFYPR